jgi:hypothetical protein
MSITTDDAIGITTDGLMCKFWLLARLWEFTAEMPVELVPLASLTETLAEPREQERVMAADLSYPIIFSAQGWLLDGGHRVHKAHALGLTEIKAVRFLKDPEPDYASRLKMG